MDGAMILKFIAGCAIALAMMVAEYLLCTRLKSPLWGGIIPCLILGVTIWMFTGGPVPLELRYVFPFVVLNLLFFGEWADGREKRGKMQRQELERMKARDM